jgi:hypothetical protein
MAREAPQLRGTEEKRMPRCALVKRSAGQQLGTGLYFKRYRQSQAAEQGERFGQEFEAKLFAGIQTDVQLSRAAFRLQLREEVETTAQGSEGVEYFTLNAHVILCQLGLGHQASHPVGLAMRAAHLIAGRVAARVARAPSVLSFNTEDTRDFHRIDFRVADPQ